MEDGIIDLGFDWKSEEEWKEYLREIEELYKVMYRYVRAALYLKSLDGTSLTYALAKTTLFHDAVTQPLWKEFLSDFYEVQVEERDVGYGEKYRIVWKGGPAKVLEDYGIVHEWTPGIYGTVMRAYTRLTNAGFKANDEKSELYEAEEFVDIAEELVKKIISLSPLINRKTFFLLSLRYIPEGYARIMYGDVEPLENLIGWKRITSWSIIPAAWQIYTITEPRWKEIVDALNILYGYFGTSHDEDTTWRMWENIEKYIGENPHKLYFTEAFKLLGIAYKENTKLSDIVDGSWLPDGDIVEGEVALDSLDNFGIKYWSVVDEFDEPKTELKDDSLIRFAAPQLFLNIANMYINVDGDWVIGLYTPSSFMKKERKIEPNEIDAVPVLPPHIPKNVALPSDWQMHKIRDFLQSQKEHLDWAAMQTPEWEDYGGEGGQK